MMRIHSLKHFITKVSFALIVPAMAFATDSYDVAVDLLQDNKVDEARSKILSHIDEMPTDPKGYLLLASIEEYKKQHAQAIETLFQGLRAVSDDKHALYFNIGNNYYALGNYDNSLSAYNQSLAVHGDYHPAILNKANVYLQTEVYDQALDQYKYYLSINPTTYQKQEIEKIIALLESALEAEREQQRQLEQRERELLDTALQSLSGSEDDGRDVDISIDQILQIDDSIDIVE